MIWLILDELRLMALYADDVSCDLDEKLFQRWCDETVWPDAVNEELRRLRCHDSQE